MAQTHSFNIHQTQSRKTQKYPLTRSNLIFLNQSTKPYTSHISSRRSVWRENFDVNKILNFSHDQQQQQTLSLFSGKYRSKTHTSRRIEADLAPWEITLCWHLWEHLGDGNHFNFHIHTIYYHYRGSEWQILMSQIHWNTCSPA